jgi:misacylated tRNA(Ala) deacylase
VGQPFRLVTPPRRVSFVSMDEPLDANTAKKEVDPRMHSAEHILTATMMKLFGCGRPFTTHLEKKKSKADYYLARAITDAEAAELERRVNEIIAAGLPVTEQFLAREQASRSFNLERLPDDAGDQVRIVKIGNYDACPCSGPHVGSTREIGSFRLVSTTWENGALRVRFKLGPAAGAAAAPAEARMSRAFRTAGDEVQKKPG